MDTHTTLTRDALRTPRAAAISGIIFSLLLGTSIVLIRLAVRGSEKASAAWLSDRVLRTCVIIAVSLVPYAGIAFLWFIGVVRDRMGEREDRFFASVFLGSGILFVATLFVATATAAGLVSIASNATADTTVSDTWRIVRAVTYALMITYSMRMAGVFMAATASIALRISIMPRWLAYSGYGCAAALLLGSGVVTWIELLFPAWVFMVSVEVLRSTLRTPKQAV